MVMCIVKCVVCAYYYWRAGVSQPSRSAGTIFLYIYLSLVFMQAASSLRPPGVVQYALY